jgi:2-dehydro-3-deoxyphosphogluconate aldolase/(4S)-4-hydroxy-2-oxoglutarate aldolase
MPYFIKIPVLQVVSSIGEILQAYEYGFMEQKLFPTTLAGAPIFISIISNVTFCPTWVGR